ncbi:glutamate receptor 1-like [Achroia grisella]|uniref:glutamate receptor 1-like n=1 Tax=Achroia grisella TaxID=688607 RepID=UPI0027D30F86|nr:glutamate receptor 1-like [Achroia grisella]
MWHKRQMKVCNQFSRGVIAMMSAVSPDSFDTLHSYTNTFQMPFVTPWFPEKVIPPSSGLVDYAVSVRPDYHRAVIDTITYYGWKNVIYIYDSHDGLLRLQQLYQSLQPGNATFRISNVKRVTNATEVVAFLIAIERLDRWSNKYVVLDSTTKLAKDALILHVRDVQLGRRNYHYFLSGLVMDDRWEKEVTEFGAINITGFRVLDFSRKVVSDFIGLWNKGTISSQAALTADAVHVLVDSILRLLRKKPDVFRNFMRRNAMANNTNKTLDCNPKQGKIIPYEHGDKISRLIKKTEIDGLTGTIRFNEAGHRKNFSLQVMELTVDGDMVKIATWYDHMGLIPVKAKLSPIDVPGLYNRNKTYIVSTIEESPYIMRQGPNPEGTNDPYKGFCVDLAEMLSQKLEIKYQIRLVKDGKYGNENPKIVGGWDGMIGEILRKEVDMVIAPLTVTVERETVVDFSKPFLSFDVKPDGKDKGSIFSFLFPLSKEIWLCILCSIFAVSVVLFIVSRFSPYEWRVVSFTDTQSSEHSEVATTKTTVVNEFNFWNALWFSLGSFMQQGSEITPRSVSGRIVGSVWWFFTLVVISSYTANMASYLTLARISEPIPSYEKIAMCPEDTSDTQRSVAIHQDIAADEHGWLAFLIDKSGKPDYKPCEMIVTITNTGVKDFAIALPKGSKLRDGINLALQSLKNDGEIQKLVRKWFTKSECDLNEPYIRGTELSLNQVAGLFYVLMVGLAVALCVALLEFCHHGRTEAARSNIPLGTALKSKARMNQRPESKTPPQRTPQREHDRLGWNGGAFTGYYSPANQIGQEETALHASFTQV